MRLSVASGLERDDDTNVVVTFTPSIDTATTGVLFSTGDAVFEIDDGQLFTKEAMTLATTGTSEFAEVATVVGGTGKYAGASGRLTASGAATSSVTAGGVYAGEICTP